MFKAVQKELKKRVRAAYKYKIGFENRFDMTTVEMRQYAFNRPVTNEEAEVDTTIDSVPKDAAQVTTVRHKKNPVPRVGKSSGYKAKVRAPRKVGA